MAAKFFVRAFQGKRKEREREGGREDSNTVNVPVKHLRKFFLICVKKYKNFESE